MTGRFPKARRWVIAAGVALALLVAAGLGIAPQTFMRDPGAGFEAPDLGPLSPGQVHWGEGRFVEYDVGALPLILSTPHGGTLEPDEVADRRSGYHVGDSDTQDLMRRIADALAEVTGRRPHLVISLLSRKKLDANRELGEAADGDPRAEQAWLGYHGFIDAAKQQVTAQWGSGLYLDIHGHGHRTQWVELGYVMRPQDLDGPDEVLDSRRLAGLHSLRALVDATGTPPSQLVRGPRSLGALVEARGYRAVPAPGDPGPRDASYFNGGYSTFRHGSFFGGPVSGIQIEHPKQGVREGEANPIAYARQFAEALVEFVEGHYGFALSRAGLSE